MCRVHSGAAAARLCCSGGSDGSLPAWTSAGPPERTSAPCNTHHIFIMLQSYSVDCHKLLIRLPQYTFNFAHPLCIYVSRVIPVLIFHGCDTGSVLTSLIYQSLHHSGNWFCSSAVWEHCGLAPCSSRTHQLLPWAQPGISTQIKQRCTVRNTALIYRRL